MSNQLTLRHLLDWPSKTRTGQRFSLSLLCFSILEVRSLYVQIFFFLAYIWLICLIYENMTFRNEMVDVNVIVIEGWFVYVLITIKRFLLIFRVKLRQ